MIQLPAPKKGCCSAFLRPRIAVRGARPYCVSITRAPRFRAAGMDRALALSVARPSNTFLSTTTSANSTFDNQIGREAARIGSDDVEALVPAWAAAGVPVETRVVAYVAVPARQRSACRVVAT